MSILQSYPLGNPTAKDYVIGTKIPPADTDAKPTTNNFSVASIAAFANTYNLGYAVYTVELSNFGLGAVAPVATIMQNGIGNIVWSYSSRGKYVGTLTGAFTANKTFALTQSQIVSNPAIGANGVNGVQDTNEWPAQQVVNVTSVNTIQIDHFVLAQSGAATRSDNIKIFLEIKVYS
jgi:hypothetical protein